MRTARVHYLSQGASSKLVSLIPVSVAASVSHEEGNGQFTELSSCYVSKILIIHSEDKRSFIVSHKRLHVTLHVECH